MQLDVMLCDGASVREGLLFVLGGGITRAWRSEYPNDFKGAIALHITATKSEARKPINVSVEFIQGSGKAAKKRRAASAQVDFGDLGHLERGEAVTVAGVIEVQAPLPKPGQYRFVVRAGTTERTLRFRAMPPGPPPRD